MGTWLPGVPYTDPTPDQVTDQANGDRSEAAAEASGVEIDALPAHAAALSTTDVVQFPASFNGTTTKFEWHQIMGMVHGGSNVRNVVDTYVALITDTSLSCNKTTAFNVSVPHFTSGDSVAPIRIFQGNSGQITAVAGTLSNVVTTGTGRAKTRAQFSIMWILPLFDFSGTSLWTVTGDTANA